MYYQHGRKGRPRGLVPFYSAQHNSKIVIKNLQQTRKDAMRLSINQIWVHFSVETKIPILSKAMVSVAAGWRGSKNFQIIQLDPRNQHRT